MTDIKRQFEELTQQLAELRSRQNQLGRDLFLTEQKLEAARLAMLQTEPTGVTELNTDTITSLKPLVQREPLHKVIPQVKARTAFGINSELEDFIGTNVISKIGILITIIGVFIGAKYATDNELISPAMRVLAGYAAALALIIAAWQLKAKFQYFSSVLMGGGLAVTYFMTYIAYNFYAMFPMGLAFAFMVVTTAAGVGVALWYNQKVIALIGQVAAYAIPFLLGNKSGNVTALFAYISVINIGLLGLSFKKDWKVLYRIAFALTWLIYALWLFAGSAMDARFVTGITFLTVTFFTFYLTFLSYKIFKKEMYRASEILVLLLNALIYFFLGAYLINESYTNTHFFTWFTIVNAVIHFTAGLVIYRLKLADSTVFQFVLGLGLLFITIAIPIELDGSWVTLLWAVEGTTLFYIGVRNKRALYLDIAVPLVTIAVLSLIQDWSSANIFGSVALANNDNYPFLNVNFGFSLFVCGCIGFIASKSTRGLFAGIRVQSLKFFTNLLPVVFIAILYFTFYFEISFYWDHETVLTQSSLVATINAVVNGYRSISLFVFTCLYFGSWFLLNNTKRFKQESLHDLLIAVTVFINVIFLFYILFVIGDLRGIYLAKASVEPSVNLLLARYFCFASLAFLWLSAYKAVKKVHHTYLFYACFSNLFNIVLLSIISNEFVHWMDIAGYQNQYKLGLSIIGGLYALALIFVGILNKKKYLRISAMVLFGVTLVKLFFYDLSSLSTISKTIVLVLLGVLLLIASFMYNKYKELLFGAEETKTIS